MPRALVRISLAALVAVVLSPAAASASTAGPRPGRGAESSYIVTLRPGANAAATAHDWRDRGVDVEHVYRRTTTGFAGRMDQRELARLRRDRRVARIEPDAMVRIADVQTRAPWGLDRIDQATRSLDRRYVYDTAAEGVTVYVIDTGVRATHTDLAGRVAPGYTAVTDGRGTDDCNGHGTHVAGTIAGRRWGAAKGVTVVPVRVLGCDGSGTWSGVIAGLEWVAAHHPDGAPAVANMSLGGGASTAVDDAVRMAIADGVTVTVAAGNQSTDACKGSPARVAEALTVAATTSRDVRASFSNWGPCVDLFAPGAKITSAYHGSDTATATMSGTSMAAPHVAGVAALRLAASPTASPAVVHDDVNAGATTGVVGKALSSPNRLVYSRFTPATPETAPVDESPEAPESSATAPSAPDAPGTTAAPRSMQVTWAAPADGGSAITGYTVQVHKARNGRVVKRVDVAGSTLEANVSGLRSGVAYFATVRATNAVGSSPWSAASGSVTILR